MPEKFEVAIVGASVGGSICAQVLGDAGVNVAIFDNSHPREKPCGGLIDSRTVEEFEIPDCYLENEAKSCISERYLFRVKLPMNPSMFLVSRKDFDGYLLQRALKNRNVTFYPEKVEHISRTEKEWIITTNRNATLKAKFLVGADGCLSIVRKKIMKPIKSEFLATTVGYIFQCSRKYLQENFERNTMEAYYSRSYVPKEGFIWIFPKKDTVNVGIGGFLPGRELKKSLDSFLYSHSAGKRLSNLTGILYAGLVPIITQKDFFELPCSGNNWALIGDAAGHVNAIGGAGIYYAMKGGSLCAQAYLAGKISSFENMWREDYGNELYYATNNIHKYYGLMGPLIWLQYYLQSRFSS